MVKRNSGTSKEDICQNQFTAYVVLAVKRKRQAYIKKKIRDKENQAKREEEQSNFGAEENTVWDRLEVQNEELVAAVQLKKRNSQKERQLLRIIEALKNYVLKWRKRNDIY